MKGPDNVQMISKTTYARVQYNSIHIWETKCLNHILQECVTMNIQMSLAEMESLSKAPMAVAQ